MPRRANAPGALQRLSFRAEFEFVFVPKEKRLWADRRIKIDNQAASTNEATPQKPRKSRQLSAFSGFPVIFNDPLLQADSLKPPDRAPCFD